MIQANKAQSRSPSATTGRLEISVDNPCKRCLVLPLHPQVMDKHLSELSKRHLETKVVKVGRSLVKWPCAIQQRSSWVTAGTCIRSGFLPPGPLIPKALGYLLMP